MTVCSPSTLRATPHPARRWLAVGWAAMAAGAAGALLLPELDDRLAAWPFLASLLIGGMPHGAMDWRVKQRVAAVASIPALARAFVPYTLHMAAWAVLLAIWPAWVVAAFLVVAAIHFGRADVWFWADRATWARPPWSGRAWRVAIARGVLVLATPLIASTAETIELLNRLIALVGGEAELPIQAFRIAGLSALLLGVATLAAEAVRCFRRGADADGARRADAMSLIFEPILLIAALALLHPLFGIGLYFLTWHATRECVRLTRSLGLGRRDAVTLAGVARLHVWSLPFWMPSMLVFIGLAAWLAPADSARDLALLLLVMFIVATPSHHLLGERDERDRAGEPTAA